MVLILDYYAIGPAIAESIGFSAARYLLLALGILFSIVGGVLFLRNRGKYRLLCIPSVIVGVLFFFGYYVSGFLQVM